MVDAQWAIGGVPEQSPQTNHSRHPFIRCHTQYPYPVTRYVHIPFWLGFAAVSTTR